MIKSSWRSGSRIRIRIRNPDPYRDTGKTCLGGGMHYPSASSFLMFLYYCQIVISAVFMLVAFQPCYHALKQAVY